MGRDQTIDTSDVFLGEKVSISVAIFTYFSGMESGPALDPHKEIEQALRK